MDEENGKQAVPDDPSFRAVQQRFFDLCENIRKNPIGNVPPKQFFPRSQAEKLRLRPSVVDRAIAKKSVISSTPMTYQKKKFTPESNASVSPIRDSAPPRNHKSSRATSRLQFSDNTNPITISSSVDQNHNQSVEERRPIEDEKVNNLDRIVSSLRITNMVSEGIQAGSFNTTTKTVQTSTKSISDVKKLGRNFTTQIVRERQTQTGVSLDKNFIQKVDNPPSPTASETNFILGARKRNRLISYSHKGSDTDESVDSVPSVCADAPWRAPSGLQDHFVPATDAFMPLDSMEDSCCDDTFRPRPPKQKRVFTNKGKEKKVNNNILPNKSLKNKVDHLTINDHPDKNEAPIVSRRPKAKATNKINNRKADCTDPAEVCASEKVQKARMQPQSEESLKSNSSATQTNTSKNSGMLNSMLNKTRKQFKESVVKKNTVTSDSSYIQPPENIEISTSAKPPRSPKKARRKRQTEESLNGTQPNADLDQKNVCKQILTNKHQRDLQDDSFQDSGLRRNPVEAHVLRHKRPNQFITSQLNQTELREDSNRNEVVHDIQNSLTSRHDVSELKQHKARKTPNHRGQGRPRNKRTDTQNSLVTSQHTVSAKKIPKTKPGRSTKEVVEDVSEDDFFQDNEDLVSRLHRIEQKKGESLSQTPNYREPGRPKKSGKDTQNSLVTSQHTISAKKIPRTKPGRSTKEVVEDVSEDDVFQDNEDLVSRLHRIEQKKGESLSQTPNYREPGRPKKSERGTQNSFDTSEHTVSVKKIPKTKPERSTKKVVEDVFEDLEDDVFQDNEDLASRLNRTEQKGESLSQTPNHRESGRPKKSGRSVNQHSKCEISIAEIPTSSTKNKQVSPSPFKKPHAVPTRSSRKPEGETSDTSKASTKSQTLKRGSPKKRQISKRLTDLTQDVPLSQDQLDSLLSIQKNNTSNISQDVDSNNSVRRSTRQRRQAPVRSVGVVLIRSSNSYKQFTSLPSGNVGKNRHSRTTNTLPSIQETEEEINLESEPDGLPESIERERQEQHSSTSNRNKKNIKSKNLVSSGKITKKENKKVNNKKMLRSVKNMNESRDEANDMLNIYDDNRVRTLKWLFKNPEFQKAKGMSGLSTAVDSGFPGGLLKIDGGKQKPTQCTSNHQLLFSVTEGTADVRVQDKSSLVNKNDLFIVPAGSEYSIKNCSAHEELLLLFAKFPSAQ